MKKMHKASKVRVLHLSRTPMSSSAGSSSEPHRSSLSRAHYLGTEDEVNSISSPSALPEAGGGAESCNPPTPCLVFLLWPIPPLKLSKGSRVTSLLYTQTEPERSLLWRTKDALITRKIPRVFEVLCQDPGTKTKYIFYISQFWNVFWVKSLYFSFLKCSLKLLSLTSLTTMTQVFMILKLTHAWHRSLCKACTSVCVHLVCFSINNR